MRVKNIKKNIRTIKRNLSSYLILYLCITSCNNNINIDEYITSNNDLTSEQILQIENNDSSKKISIIATNEKKTILFEKLERRGNKYYRKGYVDDFCGEKSSDNLILALQNEVYNYYDCIDGRHEFYIVKLYDGNYLSVENVYGIYHYSNRYYYNDKFKILKFERYFNNRKLEYTHIDNPDYNPKLPQTKFISDIKQDSINYQKNNFKIRN